MIAVPSVTKAPLQLAVPSLRGEGRRKGDVALEDGDRPAGGRDVRGSIPDERATTGSFSACGAHNEAPRKMARFPCDSVSSASGAGTQGPYGEMFHSGMR